MSLGIKQLTPDPWENIETKYPVGTKCTAKVRNFTTSVSSSKSRRASTA